MIANSNIIANDMGITVTFGYPTNASFLSNVTVIYCDIYSNKEHGLIAVDLSGRNTNVTAKYNWWGSVDGPEYKKDGDPYNPEEVYGNVIFKPWLIRPDFKIYVSPSSQTINPGESATYVITISSFGGFSSTISLSLIDLPENTSYTLNPVSLTLLANGSAQSTLTISTEPTIEPGTYTLTIIATGGGKTHEIRVTLHVKTSGLETFFTIPKEYIIVGMVGAIGFTALIIVIKRKLFPKA